MATLLVVLGPAFAQEGGQKPAEPVEKAPKEKAAAPEKTAGKPELPFQIQLLETHIRFEVNGDSRKEVHTIVKINNVLGAHEFARLTFDYNRAFQQVEIPLVRISHANGGTSELLPSAVVDAPNPAVEKYPAYQDVRVKSVRILGLADGDTIEYRVITTTAKHPLAPDFWFEHTFDKTGIILREELTLEIPPARGYVQVSPDTPAEIIPGPNGESTYRWRRKPEAASARRADEPEQRPDVSAGTFATEGELTARLTKIFYSDAAPSPAVAAKARELTEGAEDDGERLRALYSFVSTSIATVDLPFSATGFRAKTSEEILKSGAAAPEDKAILMIGLVAGVANFHPTACLAFQNDPSPPFYSLPVQVQHVLLGVAEGVFDKEIWMDPAVEVAPFGMISSAYRGKSVLCVPKSEVEHCGLCLWEKVPEEMPFGAFQRVAVEANLTEGGSLTAKVKYTLRGDNELLLRVAFHRSPKEKWKDVAGLLAISDGFRGQVTSVNVSDPMATKDPFTVEYEITQAKFVDWSKKPVRIPALLPQIGLPDPPAKAAPGEAARAIELGTPLDVNTQMTLKLPAGTVAQPPAGTSIERDYAKFSSKYSTVANTVTASRRVNFLLREIPGDRAMDYSAFVRAVQSDQAQMITLVREATEEAKTPLKK